MTSIDFNKAESTNIELKRMMKSRLFSFIILLILLIHTEGRRGGGGGSSSSSSSGYRGSSGIRSGYRGSSNYRGGGGGGGTMPWYVTALLVICGIVGVGLVVLICCAYCSDDSNDDNDEDINLQPQDSSVQQNSGEPIQNSAPPYPVQLQEANAHQTAGEPTLADPPNPQGWINPLTNGVSCNPQPPPPAYDTEGSNNATHAIPPPAYEDSDSPINQSMYPPVSSTY